MAHPNFFAELKRRNVYKVAVAYAVVAWLLIQAASIILPTFEAPSWVIKVLMAALTLGFPLAIILAWAFEITPEGIKRAEDLSPNESITHRPGRKLTIVIIALALIAFGLVMFQFVRPKSAEVVAASPTPGLTAAGAPAIPQKSIPVPSFTLLSVGSTN